MQERGRIRITDEGRKAAVAGFQMPVAEVWYRDSERIVLKVPGHSYWSSRGERSYAGAEFWVCNVVAVFRDMPGFGPVETVVYEGRFTFPVTKPKA